MAGGFRQLMAQKGIIRLSTLFIKFLIVFEYSFQKKYSKTIRNLLNNVLTILWTYDIFFNKKIP